MCFKKTRLPHPEEKPDYTQTIDIEDIRTKFYYDWGVKDWDFWDKVEIIISLEYAYPAWTFGSKIYVRPEWYNTGVLSHEVAHISYYLLSDEQKKEFEIRFNEALLTDKLVKYLYSKKSENMASFVESHAECYRFLGQEMPEYLKPYYIRLLT